jgi:hypothetical protein
MSASELYRANLNRRALAAEELAQLPPAIPNWTRSRPGAPRRPPLWLVIRARQNVRFRRPLARPGNLRNASLVPPLRGKVINEQERKRRLHLRTTPNLGLNLTARDGNPSFAQPTTNSIAQLIPGDPTLEEFGFPEDITLPSPHRHLPSTTCGVDSVYPTPNATQVADIISVCHHRRQPAYFTSPEAKDQIELQAAL